jgi:hypothetical protein
MRSSSAPVGTGRQSCDRLKQVVQAVLSLPVSDVGPNSPGEEPRCGVDRGLVRRPLPPFVAAPVEAANVRIEMEAFLQQRCA